MSDVSRREILGSAALVGGWLALGAEGAPAQQSAASGAASQPAGEGPYLLPPLPYGYSDLEPHINSQVVKLHHDVHHAGYVKGANEALAALEAIRRAGGDEIRRIRAATDALTFNLAGHQLHSIYWTNMKKDGGGAPPADSQTARLMKRDFGSVDAFVAHFSSAAAQVQGGGWAILGLEPLSQRLLILQAEKHQSMLVPCLFPLLVLDVWEHAYYLQYQNVRSSYIKAFFNVVNWASVEQRLVEAQKHAPSA